MQPITVSWTSTSSDPKTFDLILDNSESGGLTTNVKVAVDIPTSNETYILSASSAMAYGEGFVLKAESSSGDILATSPVFTLSMKSATTTDGHISYVLTTSLTATVTEGSASATDAASTLAATGGGVGADTNIVQATLGQPPGSSIASSVTSATGSNGFTTSTVSRSGSSTGTSSSSSTSATTSQNAQPKLVSSSQIAFTAAGVIAGLAALLA